MLDAVFAAFFHGVLAVFLLLPILVGLLGLTVISVALVMTVLRDMKQEIDAEVDDD